MNQELIDYIKKSKETGLGDEQIKQSLFEAGWQGKDINDHLQTLVFPKKGINKKIFFIVSIVVISLVGGFSYYYAKNKLKSSWEIGISNWQTFSNQAIQFRYPNNWTANASEINPNGFRISFREGNVSHGGIDFKVKSRIGPNKLIDYESKWENTYKNLGNKIYNKQNIIINKLNAISYDSTIENEDGLFYYGAVYIDFEDYIIHGNLYGQEKSLIDTSHAIYNSMNFLDGKAVEPKVESSVDITNWEQFSNDYLDFRYPKDWIIRTDKVGNVFVVVSSQDKSTSANFTFGNLSEMRKNIPDVTDWYVFYKSSETGDVSNERDIKIDDLTFKAYEVAGTSGKYTATTLITQNYLYYFNFTPNISNNYLSSIMSTIKIKQKAQDEMAGRQIYRNEKYGFEIRYPNDWRMETDLDNKFLIIKSQNDPILSIDFTTREYLKILSEEQEYFDKWQKENTEKPSSDMDNIVFADNPAKQFLYYSPVGFIKQRIILSRNNQAVIINSYKNSILDPILATFKFID